MEIATGVARGVVPPLDVITLTCSEIIEIFNASLQQLQLSRNHSLKAISDKTTNPHLLKLKCN